ncbi:hypothetical protein GH714_021492 [Hevea brasiliensis]|uniref:Rhamnogalacturonan lyase domain-containing protein n=1 Tax=Hevea brasiliensis TaxID=3981 RepID=A0A6A6LVS6_HEVBR|nr:hypothetical protein GH714_021492 [Hevea brasiliensis]
MANKKLSLITQGPYVLLDNGLVRLTILKPQGYLTGIKYGGLDNLLDLKSSESSRGYWDINWSLPGGQDRYQLYILKSGVSGFYCYAIYERPAGCPAFDLLRQGWFHYMAISDEKQRIMPMPEDLLPDGGVHGWISSDPIVGFWIIFPSHEFRNGGPTKQNLTAHTGPDCLAMFHGTHYIGDDILAHFQEGEAWRKTFGPFFVYLNSTTNVSNAYNLWKDAKKQRLLEEAAWPYEFVSSTYYLTAKDRGSATGRLFVQDRFISGSPIPAKHAHVGLSAARTAGAGKQKARIINSGCKQIQMETLPSRMLSPVYGLHGWVPGFIGDYLDNALVTISAAVGDYVPDANPAFVNKLFIKSPEKFRQYGLWDRYTDMHPESDQTFTIGMSDPKTEWFFAHVDRRWADNKYVPSTWTIKFNLDSVNSGNYKMRLAIASATRSDLKVYMNGMDVEHMVFQVMNLGTDNTVCRHGIHGLYQLFSIDVSSSLLVTGDNSMFLAQARGGDALCGILYDYVRLEAPAPPGNLRSEEAFDLDAKLI